MYPNKEMQEGIILHEYHKDYYARFNHLNTELSKNAKFNLSRRDKITVASITKSEDVNEAVPWEYKAVLRADQIVMLLPCPHIQYDKTNNEYFMVAKNTRQEMVDMINDFEWDERFIYGAPKRKRK